MMLCRCGAVASDAVPDIVTGQLGTGHLKIESVAFHQFRFGIKKPVPGKIAIEAQEQSQVLSVFGRG
jgi:hypothetical protein